MDADKRRENLDLITKKIIGCCYPRLKALKTVVIADKRRESKNRSGLKAWSCLAVPLKIDFDVIGVHLPVSAVTSA